jgi:hypothetical protein
LFTSCNPAVIGGFLQRYVLANMKNLVLIVLLLGLESTNRCNVDDLSNQCIGTIQPGFNFLKSYGIDNRDGELGRVEYSYVLTKSTKYFINLCKASDTPIVVTIFDSNRNKVATNKFNEKYMDNMVFQCATTGIYYIEYLTVEGKPVCGGSVLAFKRD